MIEMAVGIVGLYVIARLGWEIRSVNEALSTTRQHRDSAYSRLSSVCDKLREAEEYIDKLEGVSSE